MILVGGSLGTVGIQSEFQEIEAMDGLERKAQEKRRETLKSSQVKALDVKSRCQELKLRLRIKHNKGGSFPSQLLRRQEYR